MLRRSTAARRRVATVLFTDIVGSTELAARLGDRGWRTLLERHHAAVRRVLRRYHGREIDTAGDGFFALFDEPADAIRCAAEIVAAVRQLDIQIRAGIHTGEVELAGDAVTGIGVHLGARLLAVAAPSEVIVSSTVRDLVAGSGLEFEDRGRRPLKGVPGEWQLYVLVPPGDEAGAPVDAPPAVTADEAEAGRSRQRRRGVLAAAAVLAVGVTVVAAAILAGGFAAAPPSPSPSASPSASPVPSLSLGPNTVVAIPLSGSSVSRVIAVGQGPGQLAYGEGGLWVINATNSTVQRVDPVTGAVAAPVGGIGAPTGIALGTGRVWVADGIVGHVVWVIDPASVQVTGSIQGIGDVNGIAFGFGSLWVTDANKDLVLRIDPGSRLTRATVKLPAGSGPGSIAAGDGGVWVANRNRTAIRIDPETNEVAGQAIALCADCRPSSISVGGGYAWIVAREADKVQRIDVSSGAVFTIPVDDDPSAVVAAPGVAWVANSLSRSVWRMDASGQVQQEIVLPAAPMGLAFGDGVIWVSLAEPAR